jgi:hypothetical protein
MICGRGSPGLLLASSEDISRDKFGEGHPNTRIAVDNLNSAKQG